MELLTAKSTAILILFIGTIIFGLLPVCFVNRTQQHYPLFLSTLLCFGGGVLLSTALVHILPEARATITQYQDYIELIFCGGFFLLYAIDEIVHLCYEESDQHGHFQQQNNTNISQRQRRYSYGTNPTDQTTITTNERSCLIGHNHERQPPYNPLIYKARSDSELLIDDGTPSQLCHVNHQERCNYSTVSSLGLLVALSTHALLEGLVVGLAENNSSVFFLLGAIATHKLVASFCLGAELALNPNNTFLRSFFGILIFTFGSIIGILIGVFISNLPKNITELVIPILQSLAGGTLLYVTVSEIIPRERARWHQKHNRKIAGILQLFAVGIGFTIMTAIGIYLDID